MSRLRSLAGDEILRIFAGIGFLAVSQRGSHVKVRRVIQGRRQTLTIVLHDEVDKGTLRAIYRQALRFIPEAELRTYFYLEE